jgi:hypothetical protein
MCMEKQFHSWADFFESTSQTLTTRGPQLVTKEVCSCVRETGAPTNAAQENRHFLLHSLGEQQGTINIIFNLSLSSPTINASLYNKLRHGLTSQRVDAAIVNIGAWFAWSKSFTHVVKIAQDYEATFALPHELQVSTKIFWRSMSDGDYGNAGHNVAAPSQILTSMARFHHWHVMEVTSMTAQARHQGVPLRWDWYHFLPAMYDQWNDLLLHHLCHLRDSSAFWTNSSHKQAAYD